ncbi:hypothetical protein ACJIZ3_020257 [Penstemon smallii]|uniref:Reverse transcriptase domain-containing protein n=1 Tax=Penstemon smallii TaxID=265156 RepID=A0ABD3SIB0_9LAMI
MEPIICCSKQCRNKASTVPVFEGISDVSGAINEFNRGVSTTNLFQELETTSTQEGSRNQINSKRKGLKFSSSIESNKSPGPDGFPPVFYNFFWNITNHAVVSAVQAFIKFKMLPAALNHTFITLIPKIQQACKFEHFRPISLCNVIYKIITKILAKRLKPLLDNFIAPNQTAFIQGSNIQENSIILHEIMHYLSKKKKAFDRLEWGLLTLILRCLGFCDLFVDWISLCITSCSYSILINGASFGFFKPTPGIRQGDPLSPFLFIIYGELLSRILNRAENSSPTISHLLYADDLTIFCRANTMDAQTISDCLDLFNDWSSQKMNKDKSFIHFSVNTYPFLKSDILATLGLKECNHKLKHLGLPFCKPKNRKQAFNDIIDKTKSKIAGWKSRCLSQASRVVLIKSVAQALPIYQMSTFLLPKTICYKPDSLFLHFWWGENENNNILPLKSWSTICLPKSVGGLGFRKMEEFNKAITFKLARQILCKEDKLWIKIFQAKYIRHLNLLDLQKPPSNASWIWQDIVHCIPTIAAGACYSLSNNSHVWIWEEPWIPSLPGFIPKPKSDITLIPGNFNFVKDLLVQDSNIWNLDTLNGLFDPQTVLEITKTLIAAENEPNQFFWVLTNSGVFSSKSAYNSIICNRSPSVAPTIWKQLWSAKIHDRHKIFWWKVLNNILPTRCRLNQLFNIPDTTCPLCHNEQEDLDHIFLRCPFYERIWFCSKWCFRLSSISHLSFTNWISLLLDCRSTIFPLDDSREELIIFCVTAMASIWQHRNSIIHDQSTLSFPALLNSIHKKSFDHWNAQLSKKLYDKMASQSGSCIKPPLGWLKASSDLSFKDGSAVGAFIVRNSNGSIVQAKSFSNICIDVDSAEALALLEAVQSLDHLALDRVIFECDNLNVISKLLHSDLSLNWSSKNLIREIKKFWFKWPKWRFKFISSNFNWATHNLSKWARLHNSFAYFDLSSLPISVFCDGGYPLVDRL